MDLQYSESYQTFRQQVREFLESHRQDWPARASLARPTEAARRWYRHYGRSRQRTQPDADRRRGLHDRQHGSHGTDVVKLDELDRHGRKSIGRCDQQ